MHRNALLHILADVEQRLAPANLPLPLSSMATPAAAIRAI
jgi:hypothetical protein